MIQLSIETKKLQYVMLAISHYIVDHVGKANVDMKIRCSIATDLNYKLKARIDKQYPAKTSRFSFKWHEATTLQDAVAYFQMLHSDLHYENSILEQVKLEISKQL